MSDVQWGNMKVTEEMVLDDNPNVHLKNAEDALRRKNYDEARKHIEYARSVANGNPEVEQQCKRVLDALPSILTKEKHEKVSVYNIKEERGKKEERRKREERRIREEIRREEERKREKIRREAEIRREERRQEEIRREEERRLEDEKRWQAEIRREAERIRWKKESIREVAGLLKRVKNALEQNEYDEAVKYINKVKFYSLDIENLRNVKEFCLQAVDGYIQKAEQVMQQGLYDRVLSETFE